MQYILLVLLWISWCALHSALISLTVTEGLRKRFPKGIRFYRLFYNLFAVITLLPVLYYSYTLRGEPIISWTGPWIVIPILLGCTAVFFFAAGARRYDLLQFLGLRQIKEEKVCTVLTADCAFETGGVLSMVRHPWYSGGILIIWARPLDMAAILINLVISGYFVVGTILEERKLKVQFGQAYTDYQQRVSMLFPVKWLMRRFFRKD